MKPSYSIRKVGTGPGPRSWDADYWSDVAPIQLSQFRPESSTHRPSVQAWAVHDTRSIHVLFEVQDRYVRATRTDYQAMVCKDSCVEFFARPYPNQGYINFEVNCAGVLHCSCIRDPRPTPHGFTDWEPVPQELGSQVTIHTDIEGTVEPEIDESMLWHASISIPFSLFERYVGPLADVSGTAWTANFYKCADESSHPHWASWAPIPRLRFHDPDSFGLLRFE